MENKNFNFLWLVDLCKQNIQILSIILFLTLVLSSLASLYVIVPTFKSSVVIFPTTTHSVSKALFAQHSGNDVLEFGEEEATEQLLQVLNSHSIRDSIISRFDLYNHYDIKDADPNRRSSVNTKFNELISFKKTKFNSIEIVVFDKDPNIAANIANDCLVLMDSVIIQIRQNRASQALGILKKRLNRLYSYRNQMLDSLKEYRSYGLISVGQQTERLTEQYAIALAENNIQGAKRIKKELNILAQHVDFQETLLRKTYKIETELSEIEFEVDRVSIDTNYSLENKFIINRAYPADKKSYPVRWLIVFSSLLSVMSFSIIILSVREYMINKL